MTAVGYTPPSLKGNWLMIVRPGRLLVVDRRSRGDRLDELWGAVGPSDGVQAVLDELTRGGISRTPAFALIAWTGEFGTAASSLGLIVRGELSVVAHTDAGPTEIDGRGVSTWNERTLSGVTGLEVRTEPATGGRSAHDAELRLESGMAWATRVRIGEMTAAAKEPAARVKEPTADPPLEEQPVDRDVPSETTKIEFTIPAVVSDEELEKSSDGASGPTEANESGYDYLFGETIARTVEDAAVRDGGNAGSEGEAAAPTDDSQPEVEGDHDGKTAIGLDRATRQAARRARAQRSVTPLAPTGPRHFIDLSSGVSEELNQPVLIGRAPSVSKVSGGNLPRLVTITGPDQDISRNHAQVDVEGGTVVVTDLHSRNGTMIILPGRPPQQLRAGEPTAVIVGTVVDLGAGVTFTVREE